MYQKIVFYNYFHNGDIHFSRGFIKYLIQKISENFPDTEFYYAHRCDPQLLNDIPKLKFDNSFLAKIMDHRLGSFVRDNILYINTWYASNNNEFMNEREMSFDTLYLLFEDTCQKHLNFSLVNVDPKNLFPSIDFSCFEIQKAQQFLEATPGPKVLVANGKAKSGQSIYFNLSPIVQRLSEAYHGVIFILTNPESIKFRENVIYSRDLIGKENGSDLNENAFLGLHCPLLIGRASGVHSFCFNQANLFQTQNVLLSFSNLTYPGPFWLHEDFKDKIKYSAQVINTNNSQQAYQIIDQQIQNLWVKK